MSSKKNENTDAIHSKENKNECNEGSVCKIPPVEVNFLVNLFESNLTLKGEETGSLSNDPQVSIGETSKEKKKWVESKPELYYNVLQTKYPHFPPLQAYDPKLIKLAGMSFPQEPASELDLFISPFPPFSSKDESKRASVHGAVERDKYYASGSQTNAKDSVAQIDSEESVSSPVSLELSSDENADSENSEEEYVLRIEEMINKPSSSKNQKRKITDHSLRPSNDTCETLVGIFDAFVQDCKKRKLEGNKTVQEINAEPVPSSKPDDIPSVDEETVRESNITPEFRKHVYKDKESGSTQTIPVDGKNNTSQILDSSIPHLGTSEDKSGENAGESSSLKSDISVEKSPSPLLISENTAVNKDERNGFVNIFLQSFRETRQPMGEEDTDSEDEVQYWVSKSPKCWKEVDKKESDLSVDSKNSLEELREELPVIDTESVSEAESVVNPTTTFCDYSPNKLPEKFPVIERPESEPKFESMVLSEEESCTTSESSAKKKRYSCRSFPSLLDDSNMSRAKKRFSIEKNRFSIEKLLNLRNGAHANKRKWNSREFSIFQDLNHSTRHKIKSLLMPIDYNHAFFEYERFSIFVESNDPTKKNLAVLLFPLMTLMIYHFMKNGRIADGLRLLNHFEKKFSEVEGEYESVALVLKKLRQFHDKKHITVRGEKSLFEKMMMMFLCENQPKEDKPYEIHHQKKILKELRQEQIFSFTPESMEALVSFLRHQKIKNSVILQLLCTYFSIHVDKNVIHVDKNVSVEDVELMEDSTLSNDLSSSTEQALADFFQYKDKLKEIKETKLQFEHYIVKPVDRSEHEEDAFSELFDVGEDELLAKEFVAQFSPDEETKPRFQPWQLIVQALSSVEDMKMTTAQICSYITAHYPCFKTDDPVWQDSITTALISNKFFEKLPSDETGFEDIFIMSAAYKNKLLKSANQERYGKFNISAVDVTLDSKYIACSFDDALIHVFRRKEVAEFEIGNPSLEDFQSFAYSATEKDLKSQANKYEIFKVFAGHQLPVYGLRFAVKEDNLLLFSAGYDAVIIWSTEQFHLIGKFQHSSMYLDLDVSNCSHFFVVASKEKVAEIWSVADSKKPLNIFQGHLDAVDFCRFHPNNLYVATASSNEKTVRLFDAVEATLVRLFVGHDSKITAITFSVDGQCILSGDMLGKIFIWNITKGRSIAVIHKHRERILSLSCDSTGTFLASVGYDHCVRTYDYIKVTGKYRERKKERKKEYKPPQLFASKLNTSPFFVKYCSSSLVVVATRF